MECPVNHILIVDDDLAVCRSLKRMLNAEGFRVITAQNGEEALRRLEQIPFDVAVVDYDMPGMDGLKVLSSIREQHPGCIRILLT